MWPIHIATFLYKTTKRVIFNAFEIELRLFYVTYGVQRKIINGFDSESALL